MSQGNDRLGDCTSIGIIGYIVDKSTIDFNDIEGETLEVGQRLFHKRNITMFIQEGCFDIEMIHP